MRTRYASAQTYPIDWKTSLPSTRRTTPRLHPNGRTTRDTAAPYLEPVYTSRDRSVFTHEEMHAILIKHFGTLCWGCDFDGSIYEDRGPRYLELDHVDPRSQGGSDHLDNRSLLCGPCNREKSDTQTLIQLRRRVYGG